MSDCGRITGGGGVVDAMERQERRRQSSWMWVGLGASRGLKCVSGGSSWSGREVGGGGGG